MRSDKDIRTDVVAELNWSSSVRDEDIAVAVKDGVVTLGGTVDDYAQRYAAERAVEKVNGVRAIANDLTVKLPGALQRSDSEIAHAVVGALTWNTQVPSNRITASVTNGWVTLEGKVAWQFEKQAAERAVRYLTGVKGLTSLITIEVKAPSPEDLKERIRSSLRRQAELDALQIKVETVGSKVTLRGTVRSLAERRDAERAVWNAPGVTQVDDALVVAAPFAAGV
ncbi:MAG TPA: BON domain-containing protein [Gemmatimonadales bacterium]|jgi:osmotically-inducible protein OsmY